jgi:hypothetical protein
MRVISSCDQPKESAEQTLFAERPARMSIRTHVAISLWVTLHIYRPFNDSCFTSIK